MTKPSNSPERNSFQKEMYEKTISDPSTTVENKLAAQRMIEFYDDIISNDRELEMNTEWQKNNLEYDLRTTAWILDKARSSESYAQNVYAALCNNDFVKLDVFQILKEETWGCSWRHAGGIVADMLGKGDYIDWYCSGMGGLNTDYNPDSEETFEQWQERTKFVGEGYMTDEIKEDFIKLGWSLWKENDE